MRGGSGALHMCRVMGAGRRTCSGPRAQRESAAAVAPSLPRPPTRQRDQLGALHAAARAQPRLQAAPVGRDAQHLEGGGGAAVRVGAGASAAAAYSLAAASAQGASGLPAVIGGAQAPRSEARTLPTPPPHTWRRCGVMSSAVSPVSTMKSKGPSPFTRSCSRT